MRRGPLSKRESAAARTAIAPSDDRFASFRRRHRGVTGIWAFETFEATRASTSSGRCEVDQQIELAGDYKLRSVNGKGTARRMISGGNR
jgi:hypothetical protein